MAEKAEYDVFLSYSRPDAKAAEQLARSLADVGLRVWFDSWALVPGLPWQEQLEAALQSTSATAVCIGQSGVGLWQNAEYTAALRMQEGDQSKPLIPVLLPGADPDALPPFLRAVTWIDLRLGIDDRRELERLVSAIESSSAGGEIAQAQRMGDSLRAEGHLTEAAHHYAKALDTTRAAYGSTHPKVAGVLRRLAATRRELGELAEARALLEESLRIAAAAYGRESTDVAGNLNNLGSVLRDLGDLTAARAYFEEALAIDRRALGPEHPTVANRLNNLGSVLRDLGDLTAARAYFEEALAIDRRALGPEHPSVATTLNNLAGALLETGDSAGAISTYRQAYEALTHILGPKHRLTRAVRENLERASRDEAPGT